MFSKIRTPFVRRVFNASSARSLSCLVIAETQNNSVTSSTLAAITAASQINSTVTLLITGVNLDAVGKEASTILGVTEVLLAEDSSFENKIPESYGKFISSVSTKYSHVLAPSSNWSKNYLPRAAALVDSSPLTDILKVISPDTFHRPMYAGNAIATVQMTDAIKFLLVRSTVFDKAQVTGGNASVTKMQVPAVSDDVRTSEFISENVSKSDRPDLGSAKVYLFISSL
jgi:electron transfer flavoprotein alpha subunit